MRYSVHFPVGPERLTIAFQSRPSVNEGQKVCSLEVAHASPLPGKGSSNSISWLLVADPSDLKFFYPAVAREAARIVFAVKRAIDAHREPWKGTVHSEDWEPTALVLQEAIVFAAQRLLPEVAPQIDWEL